MRKLQRRTQHEELPTRQLSSVRRLPRQPPNRRQPMQGANPSPNQLPMLEPLRVVQLNIWKSKECMEALINDLDTERIDILLIQEPPVSFFKTLPQHRAWQLYTPTYDGPQKKRSAIYVNKRISSSAQLQVQCNSRDLTAVQIQTPNQPILIFSVYVPPMGGTQRSAENEMLTALQAVRQSIKKQTTNTAPTLVLGGDFNRQDPLWGGDNIKPYLVGSAASLISFMEEHQLQSHLPRGTPTCYASNKADSKTTLDLTLSNASNQIIKCELLDQNYGSDHRAIYSEWSIDVELANTRPPRKLYEQTDWLRAGHAIQCALGQAGEIATREQLDEAVEQLISTTATITNELTLTAKPYPYSKQWFSPELKEYQAKYNKHRRLWQTFSASLGRDNPDTVDQYSAMKMARREWVKAITHAKSSH